MNYELLIFQEIIIYTTTYLYQVCVCVSTVFIFPLYFHLLTFSSLSVNFDQSSHYVAQEKQ